MSEWVSELVSEWVNEWMSEWVNECMSEWMSSPVLFLPTYPPHDRFLHSECDLFTREALLWLGCNHLTILLVNITFLLLLIWPLFSCSIHLLYRLWLLPRQPEALRLLQRFVEASYSLQYWVLRGKELVKFKIGIIITFGFAGWRRGESAGTGVRRTGEGGGVGDTTWNI